MSAEIDTLKGIVLFTFYEIKLNTIYLFIN